MLPFSERDDTGWLPAVDVRHRLDVVGDASPCGRAALEWAAGLAARSGVELHLVTYHRLRWHAASLPPAVVARLVCDHELRTLAAAEEVLSARGVSWRFTSAGWRALRVALPPSGGLLVLPRHRSSCTDRAGALRTLPHPRRVAATLPGHLVVTVGRAPARARPRTGPARLLPLG
ncbi:MAG: hypothetical protein ACJ74O_00855 [Frankiaceae bacterium]